MPVRSASAVWNGTLRAGEGTMKMATGAYEGPFTFASRFEEGKGTSPEELIASALAGCYSMALSGGLERAGFPPTRVSTGAQLTLNRTDAGMRIVKILLTCEATAPGIGDEKFQEVALATKSTCPISAALAAVPEIALDARLV